MVSGTVFSIEEFAVFDGPGVRSALFLKGCPLRCSWCHNPEGLSIRPQLQRAHALCTGCGACAAACRHQEGCTLCGACVAACPSGARQVVGRVMTAQEAAAKLKKHERLLCANGGGITFSGGECLMQPEFVLAVRALLPHLHAAIETSGYAAEEVFLSVIREMDLVMMDVKLVRDDLHRRYTGASNAPILRNLELLKQSGVPFIARIPLIPGVTDTHENLAGVAELLRGAQNLERVELLRYNRAAGAKYRGLSMAYAPGFDTESAPQPRAELFSSLDVEVKIR